MTNSLVVNLAGSSQVAPTFWLNPQNGVSYPIVMQTPQYSIDSLADLQQPADQRSQRGSSQMLGGIADDQPWQSAMRWFRSTTSSRWSDLRDHARPRPRRGRGRDPEDHRRQCQGHAQGLDGGDAAARCKTMNSAFSGLLFGLLGAIVLIYLLIVVNFQSWSDPFVIITALPAAFAGIVWMLFATHTTLSVPALTGAIMCMGVATANSVLVVSFARERLDELGDASAAALEAGFVRLRPVLMTALAMIIGMAPMALGLGEGGEQNAPLGRAVIGGLIFATVATLFFVPVVFSIVHRRYGQKPAPQSSFWSSPCQRLIVPGVIASNPVPNRHAGCASPASLPPS